MPELDLDTVVEERSEFDAEVNAIELLNTPADPNYLCVINHPISFRSFRFGYGASGQPLNKTSLNLKKRPIGSPVPKRLKTQTDALEPSLSPEESLSSSNVKSNSINPSPSSSLTSVPVLVSPSAEDTDLILNVIPNDFNINEQNGIELNVEAPLPGSLNTNIEHCKFVIPSVSIQTYLEDGSDDSISFIDKSEEIKYINECESSNKISKVKHDARKLSEECSDRTPECVEAIISGPPVNSSVDQNIDEVGLTCENETSLTPNRIPEITMTPKTIAETSLTPNSIPETSLTPNRIPETSLTPNRIPERNHKPTQLDFTLAINDIETDQTVLFSNLLVVNNKPSETDESLSISVNNLSLKNNDACDNYENEFSDSDEV